MTRKQHLVFVVGLIVATLVIYQLRLEPEPPYTASPTTANLTPAAIAFANAVWPDDLLLQQFMDGLDATRTPDLAYGPDAEREAAKRVIAPWYRWATAVAYSEFFTEEELAQMSIGADDIPYSDPRFAASQTRCSQILAAGRNEAVDAWFEEVQQISRGSQAMLETTQAPEGLAIPAEPDKPRQPWQMPPIDWSRVRSAPRPTNET